MKEKRIVTKIKLKHISKRFQATILDKNKYMQSIILIIIEAYNKVIDTG